MDFQNMLFFMTLLATKAMEIETKKAMEQLKNAMKEQFEKNSLDRTSQLIVCSVFKQTITELEAEIKEGKTDAAENDT